MPPIGQQLPIPRLRTPLFAGVRLGLAFALSFALAGFCQAAEGPSAPFPPITSVAEFWGVSESDKQLPHPVRMEMDIHYYDGSWNLLWARTGNETSYLPVEGKPLPIRAGQRIRLEGSVVPVRGFDGEMVKVTVLGDAALPEPVRVTGQLEKLGELNGRRVELEGYILRQTEPDPTHIEAKLFAEGRVISLTMQISATEPLPQFVGSRVRVRGICDAVPDPSGRLQNVECWVLEKERPEVLGSIADDPRFKMPRTIIEQLGGAEGQRWVRIVGEVHAQEPGESLTVRDDTGQIVVVTSQPEVLPVRAQVEVVGRPVPAELGWTLEEPLFRRLGGAESLVNRAVRGPGQAPVRLRLAEQVVQLTPEEAEKRYPVTLRGVVTWFDERADYFYMQDATGGVRVRRQPGEGGVISFGNSLIAAGVTVRGAVLPEIELQEASDLSSLALPSPRRISLEQALSGFEESRWVEMRGFIRQVVHEGGWTRLDLTEATGEFAAYLPRDDSLARLQSAIVRLRGVCAAQPGHEPEQSGARLWVPNREMITVEVPGDDDPFSRPLRAVAALRRITLTQPLVQRVRVKGVVSLHQTPRYLYLQDGEEGLFVLTRQANPVMPGESVEVSGIPGRAGNRLVLREGVIRKIEGRTALVPVEIERPGLIDERRDTQLVRLGAVVRQATSEGARWKLSLETEGRIFEADLPADTDWKPPATASRVELTGVYVVEFDEYRRPHGFRLELRSPADIRVVAQPPWWNVRRTIYVTVAVCVVTLLITAWGITLRRQVSAQTEQIRRQMEREKQLQAEIDRSARLESLGVLAGGIAHDFNTLLTAVLGHLGLAAMDQRVVAAAGDCISEAERGVRRAREITQRLLTFAKGGEPVLTEVHLPEIVSEAANYARHGSNVRLDFDYPPDLPPGKVDAGQISRVIHNVVINSVQAMPDGGVVSIALAFVNLAPGEVDTLAAGPYLRLTIADAGKGIPPENLSRVFDPYFSTKAKGNSGLGLATARSIVKKHSGHIELESQVDRGTTFRIWLPAAQPVASVAADPVHPVQPKGSARILVMDDEEVIRRVAGRMLALANHEVEYAADGSEAIEAYAAAQRSGRPFDLVIFDLKVPGAMGGKEALIELRKIDPRIRAIASSGYSDDPVMANPHAYGFRCSLPKPYDIPDLMRAVEEARRN